MRNFWYGVIRSVFNILTYNFFGMKVYGKENVPKTGPIVLACNHASNFDPLLIGTAMKYHLIHFMAKEELFRNPVMGWFLRYVRTFPVHRGKMDRKAIVEALHVLKDGGVLGIFPEGTRCRQGKLCEFHEGMAAIAIKSGAPVLPAAIIGSRDLPKRNGPVCVAFGEVILPNTAKTGRQDVEALTKQVKQVISGLIDQYGGK